MKPHLKRLYFQSKHRGFKELDLILGAFAETSLEKLNKADLKTYEAFLKRPEAEIMSILQTLEATSDFSETLKHLLTKTIQEMVPLK